MINSFNKSEAGRIFIKEFIKGMEKI